MPRFHLTLEYDGTDFLGWQVQARGGRTVQGSLEDACTDLFGLHLNVTGAGRTDAGVHAEGQAASFQVETALSANAVSRALNARLPDDIAVVACTIAPDDFDPRRGARSKHYRYTIWNGPERSPLHRRRSHRVVGPLDVDAMARAARLFEGTHDFASLRTTGSSVKTSVRTVHRCEVVAQGHEIQIEVEGNGFLRHMVRALAGTLVDVGRGRRAPESIPAVLAAVDRVAAGPTAPAAGLTLVAVRYPAPGLALMASSDDSAANPGA